MVVCFKEFSFQNMKSLTCRILGSHSGGYEEFIFWILSLCSPLKVYQRFGGTYRFHFQGCRVSQAINQHEVSCVLHAGLLLVLTSSLKIEAASLSDTSVDFQPTKRRYTPETGTL
jgi:hypothetical protein